MRLGLFREWRGLLEAVGDRAGGGGGLTSPRIRSKLSSSRVASPVYVPNGNDGGVGGTGAAGAAGGRGAAGMLGARGA